jgi:L-ascorbate metabolism protein UlaG (beta-lactamase superfamily)
LFSHIKLLDMKKICLVLFLAFTAPVLLAQNQGKSDPDHRIEWWGDVDGYMNQQAKVSLGLVNEALKSAPPSLEEPLVRRMALVMIDNVLHEEKAPYRQAVQDFLQKRISEAVEEIISFKVTNGAVIWKLYNHAFVVKTPSVTIGFDIQRGVPGISGFSLSEEMIKPLLNVVDILFISHFHRDHADSWAAEQLLLQNKPVITPPDLFTGLPFYQQIIHPDRKAHLIQEVPLPVKGFNLKFISYPGHQGDKILNNVYLVFAPEEISFIHTGDQSNLADFEWIDKVKDHFKVDVAMVNSWSVYPGQRLAHGLQPKLIIPGHENEMGHTIDHREPYWLNNLRVGEGAICPWVQMAWGEKFHFLKQTLVQ